MKIVVAIVLAFLAGLPTPRPTSQLPGPGYGVMPLGDSITEGYLSSDGTGYRGPLNTALADRHPVWLGSLTDPTGLRHEGHSGWTADELAAQARGWVSAGVRPRYVLLMAGTNDINRGQDAAGAFSDLQHLVAEVHAGAPTAVVIVAKIPTIPERDATVQAFNATIAGLATTGAPGGTRVVDMYTAVPAAMLADGLHPTNAGYAAMAQVWAAALPQVVTG